MPEKIDRFDGKYRFLSNFADSRVVYGHVDYKNAEAAFQAQKTMDMAERERIAGMSPGEAKRAGRRVSLRSDWEDIKRTEMARVVAAKFRQDGGMAKLLLDTGSAELVEGNTWNDMFWGVCRGKGENWLGRILMALRQAMRDEQAGPGQTFRVRMKSIYAGPDTYGALVTLYGTDADTSEAKSFLEDALRRYKKSLVLGSTDPAYNTKSWDDATPVKQALEDMYEKTGVSYRIGAVVLTGELAV